jgi:hypothetical protein
VIALIIAVFAAWVVALLGAYGLDDQAHGRRIGGTR